MPLTDPAVLRRDIDRIDTQVSEVQKVAEETSILAKELEFIKEKELLHVRDAITAMDKRITNLMRAAMLVGIGLITTSIGLVFDLVGNGP